MEATKQWTRKTLIVYFSQSGNTKKIAEILQQKTNGELLEIPEKEPVTDVPNMGEFDVIFVGAPCWNYTAATPVLNFLQQVDFCGKIMVPFDTDGGGEGNTIIDMGNAAKNANVVPGPALHHVGRTRPNVLDKKIQTWIDSIPE